MQRSHIKGDVFVDEWMHDLKRSARVALTSLPILQEVFNDRNLQIMRVEDKDEEICKMLDQTCGIDYFILTSEKHTYGVAWRCQFVNQLTGKNDYHTFTIRYKRSSGIKTEYEKRKEAIKLDSIYPFYVAHAYADEQTNEILRLAVTTTEDEIAYCENELCPKETKRSTNKEDNSWADFYYIQWADMALYGYFIVRYYKDTGIS